MSDEQDRNADEGIEAVVEAEATAGFEEAHPAPRPVRRRRTGVRVFVALLASAVLVLAGVAAYASWAMGGTAQGKTVTVEVTEGASGAAIAEQLEREGVVRSALMFRLVSRLRKVDTGLKPGVYELRTGLGVNGVIDLLRKGIEPVLERFTIPEGKTLTEVATIVEHATGISANRFLSVARSGRHRPAILPKGGKNLEGLLFPKTYEVDEDATATQIVATMLRQFERETAALDFSKAKKLGITPYEAVIVASLVEREARVQKDRPRVASVIYNRLDRGMRLQIDATVNYAILQRTGSYKNPLTFADYEIDHPYNTYQIPALPPGPIASPGLPALRAALDPAKTDFLYYVLYEGKAEHCFARTFQEFQACRRQ